MRDIKRIDGMPTTLTQALHTVAMSDAPLAGLFAICDIVKTGEDRLPSVSGARIVLAEPAEGRSAQQLSHDVAEALVHVSLGHAQDSSTSSDPHAFDAACRLRALAIMRDSSNIVAGLFSEPADVVALKDALKKAGIDASPKTAKQRDDLVAALSTASDTHVTEAMRNVARILGRDTGSSDDADVVEDALRLASAQTGNANTLAKNLLLIRGQDTTHATPATAILDVFRSGLERLSACHSIADGEALMEWVDAVEDAGMPRDLFQTSMLELTIRHLKRIGERSTNVAAAFKERSMRGSEIIFAGQELVPIGGSAPKSANRSATS